MASDSSAVLDLRDDTDDTDGAASLADAGSDATLAPLIMEHGYDIAVKVDSPMKQLSTLETFVTYRVRCVCARWPARPPVRRRYNHFKVLHKRLVAANPWIAPPPLPPLHSARQQLDRYSPGFVAVRALALDAFLNRVAKHPILTHSDDFRIFLNTPDDELDRVFKSENSALNLWGLSSAIYGGGEAKPAANGARVKDPEFAAASDYLQSLQQKLLTLNTLTTKLYKGSVALGSEYKSIPSWSVSGAGRTPLALAALSGGARAAAAARARGSARHAALLPLLAAYAGAHVDKIRQRDSAHAACVAGSATDELHNRLEQASEALRSELTDWNAKTRADIKYILLDLAEKQVQIHQQTLAGWEQALKMSTETSMSEVFKTVSRAAAASLSPSRRDTPTERDLDELDTESNGDSDLHELREDKNSSAVIELTESASEGEASARDRRQSKTDTSSYEAVNTEEHVTSDPLHDAVDPLQNAVNPLHNAIDPLHNRTDPLNNASDPLQNARDPLQNAVNPLHNAIDPLHNRTDPLNNASDPLQNAKDPLQNAVNPLHNAIDPLHNRTDPLNNASDPLQNAIDPLQEFAEVDLTDDS